MYEEPLTMNEQRDVLNGLVYALTGALNSEARLVFRNNLVECAKGHPGIEPPSRTPALFLELARSAESADPVQFGVARPKH